MTDDSENRQPPDAELLLRQLHGEDQHLRSISVFKLRQFPHLTFPEITRFFELAVKDTVAVRDVARVAIENMGAAAVPFLLGQCHANDAACRGQAIQLLAQVGHCGGEPHKFATQFLGQRNDLPPDWGDYAETVLHTVAGALADADFAVRFAAASLLEDCNHLVEQTMPIFIEALSEGTSWQKNWAALRLGRLGPIARPACKSLADFAADPANAQDVWDKYAHQAARVALDRIG